MAESSRSIGKKRARDDENEETLSLEKNLTFSDTLIALQMMRAQFPHIEKSLKKEKVLRIFKLNTGQDDHAIMFMDDYLKQVATAAKRLGNKNLQDVEVLEWFQRHVIGSKLEVSIEHQELLSFLSLGGKVKDTDVTLLISAGVLTRQLIDPNMYWFSIPNIGSILKGLSQGRRELLQFLNRRKHKEMLLSPLEKKRLRLSPLDMRFHLRDLLGSGHLKTVRTPTGILVRVSKD